MERPYEQIRRMVKLFEYNRLKLRFRNEDERARFIDGWAEHFCETDDAEWNIAVTIMTARRRFFSPVMPREQQADNQAQRAGHRRRAESGKDVVTPMVEKGSRPRQLRIQGGNGGGEQQRQRGA